MADMESLVDRDEFTLAELADMDEMIDGFRHGTITGYASHRCRCTPCREVANEYQRRRRARHYVERVTVERKPKHGTIGEYSNHRCRCAACREVAVEYARMRRASPGIAERENANWRKRRAANVEHHRTRSREHYAANPEYYSDYKKERRKDPEQRARILSWNQNRRARLLNAFVEHVDISAIYERDSGECHLCGQHVDRTLAWPHPMSASLDHIIPLSRGGEHSYANCATSHLGCNIRKQAKIIEKKGKQDGC